MKITKYQEASEIWLNAKDKLNNYLLKRTKDPELSNELVNEVLMKLYNSCCKGAEIKNLNAWLFQITSNVLMDYYKRQNKITHEVPESASSTEGDADKELALFISPMIKFLPEKYATPLRMSDIEGVKQKQIAETLGLGLSATKSRIQRARVLLKDEIVECFELEFSKDGGIQNAHLKSSCTSLKNNVPKK